MSDEIELPVFKAEEVAPPPPPPPLPPPVEEPDETPAFSAVAKDEPIEQLRENIEFEIKRAGEPVDAIIKLLEEWEELDKKVREGGSTYAAWEEFRVKFGKVQRKIGEANGYRAALASSVLAFMLERRRRE